MKKMLLTLLVLTGGLLALQSAFGYMVRKHLANFGAPLNSWSEHSGFEPRFKVAAKAWHSSWFLQTRNQLITLKDPGNRLPELALHDVSLDIDLWPTILKARIELEIKGYIQDSKQLTHLQVILSLWQLLGGELQARRLSLHLPALDLSTVATFWPRNDQLSQIVPLFESGSVDIEGSIAEAFDKDSQKGSLHIRVQNLQIKAPAPNLPRIIFLPAEAELEMGPSGWNFRQSLTIEDSKKVLVFGLHKTQTQEPFKMTLDGPPFFLEMIAHRLGCPASSRMQWTWKESGLSC